MKAPFALALLAAVLCVERVSSLMCFSCENAVSNWHCLKPKTCDPNENYCTTTYFGGSVGKDHKKSISKGCAMLCPKLGIDIGVAAFSVDCCETALCNVSGAISVKSSSLVLLVGTLASFFYIFGPKL